MAISMRLKRAFRLAVQTKSQKISNRLSGDAKLSFCIRLRKENAIRHRDDVFVISHTIAIHVEYIYSFQKILYYITFCSSSYSTVQLLLGR